MIEDLCKNCQVDYHKTWWKDALWVREDPMNQSPGKLKFRVASN